jgi:endonuclease-3
LYNHALYPHVWRRGCQTRGHVFTRSYTVNVYGFSEDAFNVKVAERIQALLHQANIFGRRWRVDAQSYPTVILDIIVFHKLHLLLPADVALRSFRQLKDRFVDWNEVRISSVREIQDELAATSGTLEFAVFIKDLLEQVHRERQDVSLEFLADQNLGEIRRYLKQIKGVDSATADLVLRVRKAHPVLPLNHSMEVVLSRLGIFRDGETRDHKEKALHDLIEPDRVFQLHHLLVEIARDTCHLEPERLDCPRCLLRSSCDFYARLSKRARKNSPRKARPPRGTRPSHGAAPARAAAAERRQAPSVKRRGRSAGGTRRVGAGLTGIGAVVRGQKSRQG